jgi:hypothetical protein
MTPSPVESPNPKPAALKGGQQSLTVMHDDWHPPQPGNSAAAPDAANETFSVHGLAQTCRKGVITPHQGRGITSLHRGYTHPIISDSFTALCPLRHNQ